MWWQLLGASVFTAAANVCACGAWVHPPVFRRCPLLPAPLPAPPCRGPARTRAANACLLVHGVLLECGRWAKSASVLHAAVDCLKQMLKLAGNGALLLLLLSACPAPRCTVSQTTVVAAAVDSAVSGASVALPHAPLVPCPALPTASPTALLCMHRRRRPGSVGRRGAAPPAVVHHPAGTPPQGGSAGRRPAAVHAGHAAQVGCWLVGPAGLAWLGGCAGWLNEVQLARLWLTFFSAAELWCHCPA